MSAYAHPVCGAARRGLIVVAITSCLAGLPASCLLADEAADPSDRSNQDSEPQLTVREETTVTAHRRLLPLSDVGSSVTVLDRQDLEALGKTRVGEVLRTVPGVEVVRSGGPGQITSVFLRGGSSAQTLVLLDGRRLNSANSGAFDFAFLSADHLERIEVLRGPQSSLYGSEAMAGVISITTRRAEGPAELSGLAEVGEEGQQRFRIGVDGVAGAFDYGLSLSDERVDGISAASVRLGNVEDDPYENTTLSGRLGWSSEDQGRVQLSLRRSEGETGVDGFSFVTGNPVDNLIGTNERETLSAGFDAELQQGRVEHHLSLGWTDDELVGRDAPGSFGNFTIESRSQELQYSAQWNLDEEQHLLAGASYEEREGVNQGSYDERERLASVFAEGRWNAGAVRLSAGARYDDHSRFGGESTWRVTAALPLAQGATQLHASYGTGFRAPTLTDLFFPGFSNPNLQPERSRGGDLGVRHLATVGGGKLTVDLTLFEQDYEDLITFSFVTFVPENVAEARARGVEASLTWEPSAQVQLGLSHTWSDTEDRGTGQQLARRPEHRSVLRLDYQPLPKLRANLLAYLVRDRVDNNNVVLDDYERIDLSLRYRWSQFLEPYLRVENVFDESYEEVAGFSSLGRLAAVGLGFRL